MAVANGTTAQTQSPPSPPAADPKAATEAVSIQRAEATRAILPLLPTNMQEAWRVSEALARSSLIPGDYQGRPENVLAAIYMGVDLGISPMQAMRDIYVVDGRPSSAALLKTALVMQSPLCLYWQLVESTDTSATFETHRRGQPKPTRHTYTIDDAKKANLFPHPKPASSWNRRPKLMLRRRCESELADEVYPDVVKGLRTEDEAEEIQGEVTSRQTQTYAPPPPPPPPAPAQVVVFQAPPPPPAATTAPAAQTVDSLAKEHGVEHLVNPPIASAPEAKAEEKPAEPAPASAAPDAIEVWYGELRAADSQAACDALSKQINALAPKGPPIHPRRLEMGRALEAKRAELKGAR